MCLSAVFLYVYKHKKSHTTIAGNMRFYAAPSIVYFMKNFDLKCLLFIFILLLLGVYSLDLLANELQIVTQLLYLAVHLIDKAIALL